MPRQVVQYDFSGGVDQRTHKFNVVPGKLTALVNGQYDKDGAIRKRRGFTALSRTTTAGGTLSAAKHLTTLGDELVLLDGTSLHSWSSASSKWVTKDRAQPFALAPRQNIAAGSASQTFAFVQSYLGPDIAYANGFYVVSWLANYQGVSVNLGEPTLSVIDATTGAQILSAHPPEGLGNPTWTTPQVCACGNLVFFVYANATGDIFARSYNTATQTLSGSSTLVTDARNSASLSFAIASEGTKLYLVYENDAAGLSYNFYNTSFASQGNGAVDDGGFAAPWTLGTCVTSGETWWIAWATPDTGVAELWLVGHSPTTGAETVNGFRVDNSIPSNSPQTVGVTRVSSTTALVTMGSTVSGTTGGYQVAVWRQATTAGATSGALRKIPHATWASKPAAIGSRHYAWAYYYPGAGMTPDSGQETMVLCDLLSDDVASATMAARPVAVALPRVALGDAATSVAFAPLCGLVTNGTKAVTVGTWEPFTEQRALDLVAVESAPKYTSAELGQALYLSGGFPALYDGARVVEAAFITYPECIQSTTHVNGSGSLTAESDYRYSLVATWTSSKGEIVRSQPSEPVLVSTGVAEDTIRFYVAYLPFTLMGELDSGADIAPNVTFEVYRTKADGTTYYRVPSTQIYDVSSGANGAIVNQPFTYARQYEDRAADSALDGQPILYTTGGNLGSLTPPGSQILCAHKERLYLADGKDVWFTSRREAITSGLVPRWNESWRFTVEDGGPITALASNGQWLVIFKRDKIFLVGGDGPGRDAGTGQEFTPPQRVSSDVGCIEPRSVAVTPLGIVFQSAAGIYLLTGGGQVQYLSGPVEDTLAANPTVTSVTVHESLLQVRFSCNSSGTTGVVLVWDYSPSATNPLGRWSQFEFYDGTAALASAAIAGTCNSRGFYFWVANNGQAYEERATSHASAYLDGSQWITLAFETAPFKFGGAQGFQRIWAVSVLGEYYTDHALGMAYKHDYAETYEPAYAHNVTSAFGLEQVRYVPRKQKGEAIRITFTDGVPSPGTVGSGRALAFTGLAFEVKVLPKINRLPSTKRA